MIPDDVREFHRRAIVVDAHCDVVLSLDATGRSLGRRSEQGQVDLCRLAEGGVDVQFMAICVRHEVSGDATLRRAMRLLDRLLGELEASAAEVGVVHTAADLQQLVGQGRLAAVLALEGGEPLQGELGVLRLFHRLGVRVLAPTWNLRNDLADGIMEPAGSGLTAFGREVVAEMQRLGMLLDVSHLSERAFWDVVELGVPFLASHSCARALCPHPRNLSDEQLRAVAGAGGVVGVSFVPAFVDPDPTRADVERVADHVLHVAAVAGWEHVGLGSDFDGMGPGKPGGLEDVSRLPALTAVLLARGASTAQVAAALGGNLMRLLGRTLPGAREGPQR